MLTDKRVIKTRASIKKAFMQLMVEKELSKISVSDIANRASINRSTFYLHYSDVNAVMKDIEKEIENKITLCITNFDINCLYESTYAMFLSLTETLDSEPNLKSYILYSTSSEYLKNRLKDILTELTCNALLEEFPKLDTKKIIYAISFAAAGIVDTYVKWAHSEEKTITLEELIETVSALTRQILEYLEI